MGFLILSEDQQLHTDGLSPHAGHFPLARVIYCIICPSGHPCRNAPDVKVSFVVAGAGEAINGRYVLVDTQNGRPRYKLEQGQAVT